MRGRRVSMQWSRVWLDSVGGEDVARASVRKTRTRTVFLWASLLEKSGREYHERAWDTR